MRRAGTPYEGRQSNAALGWIAGAVFLVVVLALIFGLGGDGNQTAGTGTPPAATTGAAPSGGSTTVPRTTTGQGSQTTPAPSAPPSGSAK